MKYTEKSQLYIDSIDAAIFAIRGIYDVFFKNGHTLSSYMIDVLEKQLKQLQKINCREIDREFWEVCSDVDKVSHMRKVFEVKFSNILSWRNDLSNELSSFTDCIFSEIRAYGERHRNTPFEYTVESLDRLGGLYWDIVFRLTIIKIHIKDLLTQWELMSISTNNSRFESETVSPILTLDAENSLYLKLNSKRKTDFIKLLSSMYDTSMFVDEDGKPITSKQKLMEAFGEFLNDDFSAYSVSLSQAKTRDEKTFLKPFKEIEKEALRYLNAVGDS